MKAIIDDGYTRHVEIGDDITVPRIEFKYRPPRGSAVHEAPVRLARAHDDADSESDQNALNDLLLEHLEWWDFEGCANHRPDAKTLSLIDAHAFKAIVDVVINGAAPKTIFDRPEQNGKPKTAEKQAEADSGNS